MNTLKHALASEEMQIWLNAASKLADDNRTLRGLIDSSGVYGFPQFTDVIQSFCRILSEGLPQCRESGVLLSILRSVPLSNVDRTKSRYSRDFRVLLDCYNEVQR